MPFTRWLAPLAVLMLVAACQAAPAPVPMSGAIDERTVVAAGKPPVYPKVFPMEAKPRQFPVAVIAHRGYAKVAPENTMASFRAALDAEADVIELDVHLTKDHQLIVMHDDSVDRTTDGHGKIEHMTLAQMKALDAGSWFSQNFVGERVPTLDEVLELVHGRANMMIEIKTRSDSGVSTAVSEALERHQMVDQVLVSSFYEKPIAAIRKLHPELSLGALVLPAVSLTGRALKLRASQTQGAHRSISQKDVEAAHALGMKVHAWTVDGPDDMARLAKIGVDGIITNDVGTCQRVLFDTFYPSNGTLPEPQPMPSAPPAPVSPEDEI